MPEIVTYEYKRLPSEVRQQILKRDNYTCQDCGYYYRLSKLHIHHKLAQRYGGTHDPDNLITLCCKCHRKADLQLFRDGMKKYHEGLNDRIKYIPSG